MQSYKKLTDETVFLLGFSTGIPDLSDRRSRLQESSDNSNAWVLKGFFSAFKCNARGLAGTISM